MGSLTVLKKPRFLQWCSRYQIIKPDFGDLYFPTNYCLKMTDFRQINRKFLLEFIELFAVFRVYGKYIHCIQVQLDIYSLIKTFNKAEVFKRRVKLN
jgi:hypothetical protein